MRKLFYVLLILHMLCWGIVAGIVMPGASAHAAVQRPEERVIARGSAQNPVVALTFDDGPNPVYTPQILSVLRQYGVSATFFDVGQLVQQYPGLVLEEYQEGHVVGNHSWSHPVMSLLSAEAIQGELSMTSAAIEGTIGVAPVLFRPPYGATNATVEAIAAQMGLVQILWTVDTNDWRRLGVASIVNAALSDTRNGSIVLMHDAGGDRSQTVAALPQIISGLQARGFTFVTVPQLFGMS